MKDKKGFTLIELLAVIVILGIIMLVAIPAVTGYISGARNDSYKDDAALFIDGMKNIAVTKNRLPFGENQVALFKVHGDKGLQLDSGGKTSPYGPAWDNGYTYVAVARVDGEYIYAFAGNDAEGNFFPLSTVDYINDQTHKVSNLGSKLDGEKCIQGIAQSKTANFTCGEGAGAQATSDLWGDDGFLKLRPTSDQTGQASGKIYINGIGTSSDKIELTVVRVYENNRIDENDAGWKAGS